MSVWVGLAFSLSWIVGQAVPNSEIAGFVTRGVFLVLFLPVAAGMGLWWVVVVTGYIAVVAQLLIFLARITLPFARELMWRIVEYNKGAWAAITLCVTVILALQEIALRAIHA